MPCRVRSLIRMHRSTCNHLQNAYTSTDEGRFLGSRKDVALSCAVRLHVKAVIEHKFLLYQWVIFVLLLPMSLNVFWKAIPTTIRSWLCFWQESQRIQNYEERWVLPLKAYVQWPRSARLAQNTRGTWISVSNHDDMRSCPAFARIQISRTCGRISSVSSNLVQSLVAEHDQGVGDVLSPSPSAQNQGRINTCGVRFFCLSGVKVAAKAFDAEICGPCLQNISGRVQF